MHFLSVIFTKCILTRTKTRHTRNTKEALTSLTVAYTTTTAHFCITPIQNKGAFFIRSQPIRWSFVPCVTILKQKLELFISNSLLLLISCCFICFYPCPGETFLNLFLLKNVIWIRQRQKRNGNLIFQWEQSFACMERQRG